MMHSIFRENKQTVGRFTNDTGDYDLGTIFPLCNTCVSRADG